MKNSLYKNQNGAVVILAAVIVSIAALLAASTTAWLGMGNIEIDKHWQKGEETLSIADGCLENVLLRWKNDKDYMANDEKLFIGSDFCIINTTGVGAIRRVNISAFILPYVKKITAEINTDNDLEIISRQEN